VLADTSVWVDHLRRGNRLLAEHLQEARVLCHPFVIGELACGNLKHREEVLSLIAALPRVPAARDDEVLAFVEANRLTGRGLSWIDMHLLASTRLAHKALWTLDKRLAAAARSLNVEASP
jgi:predicted nucleic acid-binding protein